MDYVILAIDFQVKVISPEPIEKVTEEAHGENHTPKAGVRLLPSNNLEWTVKMAKVIYFPLNFLSN